ncbi:tyrosine-type recombinase/integrase [Tepidimonas charontis]|uniref:Prophage integrase IntA n=1 Tax=Tepidimonas charontis TaxID=2267262 RepID=A0A554X8E5_9BURK|nr:integrase arm-type DNA-binding domain-containing protein [Tepidimonas charontis]TSE32103.1 Prophage integrase IntA [Tepidimonas charontis]
MLTDAAIRALRPTQRPYKASDAHGLYVLVTPGGSKLWRFKYRHGGRERLLALGAYPAVTLREARELRDEARRMLARGLDPCAERQAAKRRALEAEGSTFAAVAEEWRKKQLSKTSARYQKKCWRFVERDLLPYLGDSQISEIGAPKILEAVRRVESRGVIETAHKVLQLAGQIFRYAVATGKAQSDPTPALRGALEPVRVTHMAAPTDPKKVGEILRTFDAFRGGPIVAAALRLLPLVFVRPGELRTMQWKDIDFDTCEWKYTVSKTKTPHIVPLSRQAIAILKDIHPLTGHLQGGYVFPSARSSLRPMSDAAINAALKRLGIDTKSELTAHGWRAVARTLLHEQIGYPPEVIEHQLAHAVPDPLGRAYNRTKFLAERKKMMQKWADYLDKIKNQ